MTLSELREVRDLRAKLADQAETERNTPVFLGHARQAADHYDRLCRRIERLDALEIGAPLPEDWRGE